MFSTSKQPAGSRLWCRYQCSGVGTSKDRMLTPDTRLRGRSRYGAAKARNLTPVPLEKKIDILNPYFMKYVQDTTLEELVELLLQLIKLIP
jgi:hypothetical protein